MKYNNVVFNIDDIFYKEEFQLFPQIKQVIQSLKARGIKLGIITSKTKEEYKKNFSKSEIESYFDLVIFAEDINNKQPIEKYL